MVVSFERIMRLRRITSSLVLASLALFVSSTLIFATFKSDYVSRYLENICSRRKVVGINAVLCSFNERLVKLEEKQEAIIGAMPDTNSPQLGLINFSGTAEEYHFWFTPNTNVLDYIAGHTYHVIYKAEVDNPGEWCGQALVVDRPPYNLFGNAGEQVYFKIFDITTGDNPCF